MKKITLLLLLLLTALSLSACDETETDDPVDFVFTKADIERRLLTYVDHLDKLTKTDKKQRLDKEMHSSVTRDDLLKEKDYPELKEQLKPTIHKSVYEDIIYLKDLFLEVCSMYQPNIYCEDEVLGLTRRYKAILKDDVLTIDSQGFGVRETFFYSTTFIDIRHLEISVNEEGEISYHYTSEQLTQDEKLGNTYKFQEYIVNDKELVNLNYEENEYLYYETYDYETKELNRYSVHEPRYGSYDYIDLSNDVYVQLNLSDKNISRVKLSYGNLYYPTLTYTYDTYGHSDESQHKERFAYSVSNVKNWTEIKHEATDNSSLITWTVCGDHLYIDDNKILGDSMTNDIYLNSDTFQHFYQVKLTSSYNDTTEELFSLTPLGLSYTEHTLSGVRNDTLNVLNTYEERMEEKGFKISFREMVLEIERFTSNNNSPETIESLMAQIENKE